MQIFDFSSRFFSKTLIGFTLSSLDLLVLQINSGAHLKGLTPVSLRLLIFKEILNKISLNLSFKLGTFCKFLKQE